MATHRDRPLSAKSSPQSGAAQPSAAPIKKTSSHSDLAQAIRREIDRAIG